MSVRIRTLPGLRVISASGDVPALAGRRLPQALLVHLAVERSATRDSLMALLWPDRDGERARHSLSQALHELRRHLGDVVDAGGDTVVAGADLETDFEQLEAAVDGGRWAEALQLYGGPFLEGVYLASSPAFEQWVDRRRAQATRLHRRARRELLADRLRAEDVPGALAVAERWAELEPLEDEAQQRTIELLARSGRRQEALEHLERFRARLRAEGLEPMPELELLGASIAAARLQGPEVAGIPAAPAAAPGDVAPAATVTEETKPEPPHRERRTGDLLLGALLGLLVGAPSTLLAAGAIQLVRPGAIPLPFLLSTHTLAGLIALAGGAGAALVLVGLRARPGAARAVARPNHRLGAGLGFAMGVLVTLTTAFAVGAGMMPGGPRAAKVVVTRFVNRAGDPALEPIARMAEDWAIRRLGSIHEAQVVAGGAVPVDTAAYAITRLSLRLGADLVVLGSVYREGSDVILAARVVPPAGSRLPRELESQPIGPVRAPLDRPTAGAERLASVVAGAVAALCRSPECAPGRRPPTYEAREAWLDALATNLQRADVQAVRQGFRRALTLDSTFVNAYTGLANSYLREQQCVPVDSIGDILEARHQDFAEFDLLYMRAMRATCHGDLDAAYQYRAEASALAPNNVGAQWGAAEAAAAAGRMREAERRLQRMTDTWYRDELYYYALYTSVLHYQGKISEELRLAEAARARLKTGADRFKLGAPALTALGRTSELEARIEEARRSQMRFVPLAELYAAAGLELEWHGHVDSGRQFAARALQELERATPAERETPDWRSQKGALLIQLGLWREARDVYAALEPDTGKALDSEKTFTRAALLTARGVIAAKTGDGTSALQAIAALDRLPASEFVPPRAPAREECHAAILAALGLEQEALRQLADGQARGTVPRSSPRFVHANLMFRDLWHEPQFEVLFRARD